MEVTVTVKRFNPDIEQSQSYVQEYQIELEDTGTVLDGLIKIREEIDGSLALRCSCRSAICGSCAMRINGKAGLACNTKLVDVVDGNGNVEIEPAGNTPVVKDLVVELDTFWDKIRDVSPWLQPDVSDPDPDKEFIASNESMLHLTEVTACIMCGACVSDCTVMEVDPSFLGPAALAKAYRFVADPRDDVDSERLASLNGKGGIWDCTRCMQCVEVCPKGVDPMGRIMALRDLAMQSGFNNTYGARHATAFTDSVKHSGWLDELRLPIKTFGIFNVKEMLKLLPVGFKAQLRGKRPPIFHRSIPGAKNVRKLFERFEDRL